MIAEIAASSASYDLRDKLHVYRRNRVQDYLVWRINDGELDWFSWQEGHYVPLVADAAGVIESQRFPGLRLSVRALLTGNLAEVLAELQRGLASAEHKAFVKQLQASNS